MRISRRGHDDVLVGRIRKNLSNPSGHSIAMFLAADQLLKGAALNPIQIAAAQYAHLFDYDDPADASAITDDFMSAGRISGAECIPIPQLQVAQFKTINGKRLQVSKSQIKYKRELEYPTDIL